MIFLQIFDHDLHRSKRGIDGTVFWIETPFKSSFLPAIVSLSTPKFAVVRKISNGMVKSGVFKYDQDRLDELIPNIMSAAHDLSVEEKWDNIHRTAKSAFDWLQKQSGTELQPHCVLIPSSWDQSRLLKWAGKANITRGKIVSSGGTQDAVTIYKKICRIYRCGVVSPVFLSRPDYVGMYTQILGGRSSLILHNIRHGMAFCSPSENN